MACAYTHGVVPGSSRANGGHPVPSAPRGFPGPSPAPPPSLTPTGHHYERESSPAAHTSFCSCCPPPPQCPCCPPSPWHPSSPSTSSHPPQVHHPHTHESSLHQNSPHHPSPPHSHTSHSHTYHPPPHFPHSPGSHPSTSHHSHIITPHYPSPHPQTPSSHILHSHPPSSPPSLYSHHHQHQHTPVHHPPYTASPLHHSWRNPHSSSTFHPPRHGTETTHSSECCTSSSSRGIPPQNPRSVCQVNPTRRQIIPSSAAFQENTEEEPTSPPFVAETPPPDSAQFENAEQNTALPSLSESMQRRTPPIHRGVGVNTPTPKVHSGVTQTRQEQEFRVTVPTNNQSVALATCSTPPHNLHAATPLEFSPYDGVTGFSRINFQLATPAPSLADVLVPVHRVQIPEPVLPSRHQPSRGASSVQTRSSTAPLASSFGAPENQLMIEGSSSSLLNHANEDELEIPMADSGFKSSMQGGGIGGREHSSTLHQRGETPLIKPLTSFSGDEKIGREMVLLEQCSVSGSSWRMDSSHSTSSLPSFSVSLSGRTEQSDQYEDSDSDLMANGRGLRRKGRRQGETFFDIKDEEMNEEEEEEEDTKARVQASVSARMTRSQAVKLVSDSEMSQSESDPTTSTRRRRNRPRKRASPPEKRQTHGGGATEEAGSESEEDAEVTLIAESDDQEKQEENETLARRVSPIANRTRSRVTATDSSQSEGEMVHESRPRTKRRNSRSPKKMTTSAESRGERERGRKRETRKRGSGGPVIIDTSQSESECSVAMATDPAPIQSNVGRVTRKKRVERRGGKRLPEPSETVCEALEKISVSTDNVGSSNSQVQLQNVEKEMMSSSGTMMSSSGASVAGSVGEGLRDWYIRIVGKNLIVVEGIKNDNKDRTWHSGPIVKRLSSRLVATRSGTLYRLDGPLNREGLDKLDIGELAVPFEDGFPENWLSVINRYLLQNILLKKENKAGSVEKEEKGEEEGVKLEEGVEDGGKIEEETSVVPEEEVSDKEREKKEEEEEEDSDFPVVLRKKSVRRGRSQLLDYDSSASERSERSEEGERRRGRRKKTRKESNLTLSSTPDILTFNPSLTDSINPSLTDNIKPLAENLNPPLTDGLNPSLTDNLNPSLTENINPSLTEETQSTTDDELVRGTRRLRVKEEEEEEGEGVCPTTTPEATPNTSASSFISSLKRSSRGRTLKPANFSNSTIQYSYDMRGNFIGLSGPVVDLTLETSGYLMNDSLSTRKPRQVKKETVPEDGEEGDEGGGGVTKSRGKERKGGRKNQKKTVKRSRVIPVSLSRRKNTVIIPSETTEGEGVGEKGEEGEDTTKKPTSSEEDRGGGVGAVTVEHSNQNDDGREQPERELEPPEETDVIIKTTEREKKREEKKKEREKRKEDDREERESERGGGRGSEGGRDWRNEKVVEDCLVSPGSPRSVSLSRVKLRHKEAKKRVSISNEVIVMGAGRGGGEEERRERGEGESCEWTSSNRRKLSRVVHSVPAITDNFWEVVSEKMATGHTAEECGSEYFRMKGGKRGKRVTARGTGRGQRQQQEPAEKVPPPALTAKVGTIKRKRQVRDILDHLDQGHTDDWFGSTPFKKSKFRNKVVEVEIEDGSEDSEPEEDRLLTTPVGTARQRLGVAGAAAVVDSHTPTLCEYGSTPDYNGGQTQTTADHVIYKQQKAKKGPKKHQLKLSKPVSSKITQLKQGGRGGGGRGGSSVSHGDSLHTIRSGELTALRRFEDSDDSCDSNPFSDMEDACQDLIARLH